MVQKTHWESVFWTQCRPGWSHVAHKEWTMLGVELQRINVHSSVRGKFPSTRLSQTMWPSLGSQFSNHVRSTISFVCNFTSSFWIMTKWRQSSMSLQFVNFQLIKCQHWAPTEQNLASSPIDVLVSPCETVWGVEFSPTAKLGSL